MALSVVFPTQGALPSAHEIGQWLTEQGEAFELEGPDVIALKAVPIRFLLPPYSERPQAQLEINLKTPLTRVVELLFAFSLRIRADISLVGQGSITRPEMWLTLAETQTRLRLAQAIARSQEMSNAHEVHQKLWGMVHSLCPNEEVQWDPTQKSLVRLVQIGEDISVDEASWFTDDPQLGDRVGLPVPGHLHILTWTWLSEAYPALADL